MNKIKIKITKADIEYVMMIVICMIFMLKMD